jgi:CubicO group peptidase (beta-lactamase class C family)
VFKKAYGEINPNTHKPMTPDAEFCLASIAKVFTAVATYKMVGDGKLSLDDKLSKFFPNVPPDKASITVKQLLTHTSGLSSDMSGPSEFTPITKEERLKSILEKELESKPGTQFGYSNDGFTMLAMIIEKASGQPFETYVRTNLFKAAGLKSTGFYGDTALLSHPRAIGNGPMPDSGNDPANWKVLWWIKGAGGIVTNTDDLWKFCQALGSGKILNKTALPLFLTPRPKVGPSGWMVGRNAKNVLTVGHMGASGLGYATLLGYYPEKKAGLIILSNTGMGPDLFQVHTKAVEAMTGVPLKILGGRRP